jgi:hypothetical protein
MTPVGILNIRCDVAAKAPIIEIVVTEDFGPDLAMARLDWVQAEYLAGKMLDLVSLIKPTNDNS